MTSFAASSIDMSSSTMSSRGKNSRKPEVGFGVVGTKTETISPSTRVFWEISPFAAVEMKPIAQMPRRGYSTRQAFSKLRSLWAKTVSAICLMPE
jgi:hypothetical protein